MRFICQDYPEDHLVFREDEPGDCAYVIKSGSVDVFVEREGRHISVATLAAGEIFGEMAIISNANRSASVRTLEPTTLQRIEPEQVRRRITAMDPVMRTLTEVILTRLHTMLKRVRNMPGQSPLLEFHDLSDARAAIVDLTLENDIARGIEADEFTPWFQPIVRLADREIVGFEALSRWQHPNRGLLAPNHFIDVAEDSGLIRELTRDCLSKACSAMAELRLAKLQSGGSSDPLFVTVNVSAHDLEDETLLAEVGEALDQSGLEPGGLKIEVTERSIMQSMEQANAVLSELKSLGVGIAIDDFGTGYSSMSHLAHLPITTLKIDRSFVSQMMESSQDRKVVSSIVRLSDELGFDTVAEGIESEDEASILSDLNCQMGQGYLFAKPVRLDQACNLIRSSQGVVGVTSLPQAASA
ncbi:MAG: EAL domain-containing protein [Pseudomonadota bacterium]